MLAKVIPTRVHGILDYLSGILFLALPRLLNWDATATNLLTTLGIGVLVYSLLTRYELGLFRLLPMRIHLAIDILATLLLIVAPFVFDLSGDNITTSFLALGIFELAATLLTDTEPKESAMMNRVQAHDPMR